MDRNHQNEVVFSIHRQVKQRLFYRLDDAQLIQGLQWITTKMRHLFPRQVPYEEDLSDKNKACTRYISHILALSGALSRTSHLSKDPTMLAQLLLDGGIYLWSKRLLDDAQALLDKAKLMCEMRDEDKVLLSETYSIRAAVLVDSGNLDEAPKYFELAMTVIKEHLKAVKGNEGTYNHIYLANAYNNLGAMYAQLGDYDKAKTQIKVSLFLKEKW
jgi:tetratricopeptide (TPR) repeat protein